MTTDIRPISIDIHRTKSFKNEVIRKANSDRDTGMKNENEREKQGKLQQSMNEAAADKRQTDWGKLKMNESSITGGRRRQ